MAFKKTGRKKYYVPKKSQRFYRLKVVDPKLIWDAVEWNYLNRVNMMDLRNFWN